MNVKIDKGMTKEIMIDGIPVLFRADASIPRLYRIHFGRDVFADMGSLMRKIAPNAKPKELAEQEVEEIQEQLDISSMDTEVLENMAYIMAYHADNTIPDNIDDWLDQFEMFSIYEVLPEILALWGTNLITDVDSKKNLNAVAGR